MKRIALAAVFLAMPVLPACVIIDSDEGSDGFDVSYDYDSPAGTVYGAMVHTDHVEFLVTSNGCTDESNFQVDVDHHGMREVTLELDRIKADHCKALMAEGTLVSWSFEDLGIEPGTEVNIVNRVARR